MKYDNDENVEALPTSIFRDSTQTPSVSELLTLEENHGVLDELLLEDVTNLIYIIKKKLSIFMTLNHLAISKALSLRMESSSLMLQLEVYLKWLISVSTK